MIRISKDTFSKMHFLKQPFETHDEALGRILQDYKDMERKIRILEDAIVKKNA